jgi:ComF family protein
MMIKTWSQLGQELIWPRFCYRCGRGGTYLCDRCWQALELAWPQEISRQLKHRLIPGQPFYLTDVQVAFAYQPLLAKMMREFKYAGVSQLAELFGYSLYQFLPLSDKIDAVTAIPLTKRRERARGYNQAQLLAQVLARHLALPTVALLQRQGETKPQVQMRHSVKRQQSRLDFRLRAEARLVARGSRILLVDDVVTTGATLNSAARVLSEAGYQVQAAAVAHGS